MNCLEKIKIYIILRYFYSIVIFLLIIGCNIEWEFSITNIDDPSHPQFCFSRSKDCKGSGVELSMIDISEIDNEGKIVKDMWTIVPIRNNPIKYLTYGTVPDGYKELMPAIPLTLGKYYTVHGGKFYFRMVLDENAVKSEVYELDDKRP